MARDATGCAGCDTAPRGGDTAPRGAEGDPRPFAGLTERTARPRTEAGSRIARRRRRLAGPAEETGGAVSAGLRSGPAPAAVEIRPPARARNPTARLLAYRHGDGGGEPHL